MSSGGIIRFVYEVVELMNGVFGKCGKVVRCVRTCHNCFDLFVNLLLIVDVVVYIKTLHVFNISLFFKMC